MAITLPPLPYPDNALEPAISATTLQTHHGKHHKAYVDKTNAAIEGTDLADATAGMITGQNGATTNDWAVNLEFTSEGGDKFGKTTSRLYPLTDPRNRFAVTIDGYVITAPTTQAVITGGSAQITGSYDQTSSTLLANN